MRNKKTLTCRIRSKRIGTHDNAPKMRGRGKESETQWFHEYDKSSIASGVANTFTTIRKLKRGLATTFTFTTREVNTTTGNNRTVDCRGSFNVKTRGIKTRSRSNSALIGKNKCSMRFGSRQAE
jgi:hypothetical protein